LLIITACVDITEKSDDAIRYMIIDKFHTVGQNSQNNATINEKMTQLTKMKLGLLRFRQLNDAIVHSGVPLYFV